MKPLLLLILAVGLLDAIEEIHDTCNSISQYMGVRSLTYNQNYSGIPDEVLSVCPGGPTCCNGDVEAEFEKDAKMRIPRVTFNKQSYISQLTAGRSKIGTYMTQVLTLASSHNNRTTALVSSYIAMSDQEVLSLDLQEYPKAALLDIAESHGVTDLLPDNPECVNEMIEYLRKLGNLQMNGLYLARLLYTAIPEGINVLGEMASQTLPQSCIMELVKSHRCNLCLDSTDVKPCRAYCLDVASVCYAHLKEVASAWEEYAELTSVVLNSIDKFAGVYQGSIQSTMRAIQEKLRDSNVADMCGFDVASNLVRRRRSDESKVRAALFDGGFMTGMLGRMDEIHCSRMSTTSDKCWNGSNVSPYNGGLQMPVNNMTVTEGLQTQLALLEKFNQNFKKVTNLEIKAIEEDMDQYNIATEAPEFVKDGSSTIFLSLTLYLLMFLLH